MCSLQQCGFTISSELMLPDAELSFEGPALPEVIEAWGNRLDRLKLLRDLAGPGFDDLREEFLQCLASPEHQSTARVCCCIAVKSGSQSA